MGITRKQTIGLSKAEDTIDTALAILEDVVDRAMRMLKKKRDRKKLIAAIETYCVNHPDAR